MKLKILLGILSLALLLYSANGQCGKSYASPAREGYIMGGEDAEQGAWPWMVAVMKADKSGKHNPWCTGFLIDKRRFISAAHCFDSNQTSAFSTRIGHVNIKQGTEYPISDITVHEGYKKGHFYNDIALVTLTKDVDAPNFNPVCLPPPRSLRNLTGRGSTVVGWGATRPDGPLSLMQKQLSAVPVLSNAVCEIAYRGKFSHILPKGITPGMMCAGFLGEEGKDSCGGDSGGPLMVQEQNRFYAVGVVAFGYQCGRPDYPGVYTRVSEYVTWIDQQKGNAMNAVQGSGMSVRTKYPWISEQCVDKLGGQNPCKDVRECELASAILSLGGWPTVCGWVDGDQNGGTKWPKVCCGMPLIRGSVLSEEIAQEMGKKINATAQIDDGEGVVDGYSANGNYAGQCALPLQPRPDTSVQPEDGIRFGNTPYSRQEFSKSSEFLYNLKHESIFGMEFKTTADNGVMFYVGAGNNRVDYVGLVMKEGKIIYLFECGSGRAVISSANTYNDGMWHRVVFYRQALEGSLIIDDDEEIDGESPGTATFVDQLRSPLYVGGVSEEVSRNYKRNLLGINLSFPGCIRNVEGQGEPLARDTQTTMTDTTGCSDKVEEGTFFFDDGGYLVLQDKYRMPQRLTITLDIKPRNHSGILMVVQAKQNYFILQLVDGRIEFTVDNGAGPITATYNPNQKDFLCDGKFHTVQATKSGSVVSLSVDGVSTEPVTGPDGSASTSALNPLYVGGVPDASMSRSGVRTKDQYVGCIRGIEMNQVPQAITQSKLIGHITLNTCPTI